MGEFKTLLPDKDGEAGEDGAERRTKMEMRERGRDGDEEGIRDKDGVKTRMRTETKTAMGTG